MAGGQINFPPEIMEAVSTMQRAAGLLDQEMQDLKKHVGNFVNTSKSAAVGAFDDAHQMWQKSGLTHNEALNGLAKTAGDSYQDITSFDQHLASKLA